ncbi:sulfur carrier protein ThiS [Bacillus sp. BHET2]|uniref:sulfur carrier protein ThiS n=1 Tax=Bacillus sp. BHET2 TaxID=2583818 RepID=UPI00110F06DD|nr:sulfur carrier protein ThiS [Bacillus sp. BHET2]TMU87372.1 sulfur carrier protein ThiS [Bacillus sp. BHET2]
MELRINGQLVTVPDTTLTINDLIYHYKLENRMIIVEQNQTILEKEEHGKTKVKNGDTIELVQFVGGG